MQKLPTHQETAHDMVYRFNANGGVVMDRGTMTLRSGTDNGGRKISILEVVRPGYPTRIITTERNWSQMVKTLSVLAKFWTSTQHLDTI